MEKKVSVIVPCYNVEKYIDKCINSIVVQTYDNLEIILINDGSIDLTEEKCNEWAKKDKRIRVINKEHEGTVQARKTGIRMATGAYACYVDSDDWIDSCMIERLYTIMNDSGVDIVTSCMHGQGIRKEDFLFEERRYDCKKEAVQLYSNMVLNKGELAGYTAGKLYRKELLEECQLRVDDNITYGEDEACVWDCYLSASAIYITFEEYYHYNRRENSTMTIREDRDYWKKINVLYKYLYELFDNSDYRHVLLPQLEQHIITVWLLNHVEKIVPNKKILPMYSFPYDQVPYGSKIVIHGAGKVGQSFFYQIKENHYCEIVAWTDKNCRRNGNYEIGSLQDISRLEFDYVILAASLNRVIQDMESDVLMSGIDKGKVIARVAEKNSFYYVL